MAWDIRAYVKEAERALKKIGRQWKSSGGARSLPGQVVRFCADRCQSVSIRRVSIASAGARVVVLARAGLCWKPNICTVWTVWMEVVGRARIEPATP